MRWWRRRAVPVPVLAFVVVGLVACQPQAAGDVERAPAVESQTAVATKAPQTPSQAGASGANLRGATPGSEPTAATTMAVTPTTTALSAPAASSGNPRRALSPRIATPSASILPPSFDRPRNACVPDETFDRWLWEDYVQWSPDGSIILFSRGPVLSAVTADGKRTWLVADAGVIDTTDGADSTTRQSGTTIPFDTSPDGTLVVHATCRYGVHPSGLEGARLEFELATVGVDGTDPQRLTSNDVFDSHPAWSPDGHRIAHLYGRSTLRITSINGGKPLDVSLPISEGSEPIHEGPDQVPEVITQAPAWSPDGRLVAVATRVGMFILKAHDGEVRQIAPHVSGGPSWSPDGTRLAFVKPAGQDVTLITVAVDGSDEKRLASFKGWGKGDTPVALVPTVAWSPDGSKILLVLQPGPAEPGRPYWRFDARRKVYVVAVEARGQARRIARSGFIALNAAWAPDGSRVVVTGLAADFEFAVVETRVSESNWNALSVARLGPMVVFTTAPDGRDQRVVAERHRSGRLEAWNAPPT